MTSRGIGEKYSIDGQCCLDVPRERFVEEVLAVTGETDPAPVHQYLDTLAMMAGETVARNALICTILGKAD